MQRIMHIITTSQSELRAVEAVDKLARLVETRAKLFGFNEPAKQEVDVTHTHTITAGVDDRIAELLKMRQQWATPNPGQVPSPPAQDIIDAEIIEDGDVAPLVARDRGVDPGQGGGLGEDPGGESNVRHA